MKNNLIIMLFLFSTILAQQISRSDIEKLSNLELEKVKSELQSKAKATIVDGVSKDGSVSISNARPVSITSTALSLATGDFFGYNYFKKDLSYFDNIPTPVDYRLGPGDEITISLWGEKNSRYTEILNKDGAIFYENIGFINLTNKTLQSAEVLLKEKLSKIYSSLNDDINPTMLMVELGKLKSINVYFSGHIDNPGINLVHPFSDIFSAIISAGGVSSNGSLRKIQLIRNGNVIDTVDFYTFFMNGKKDFSSIKLIDGDVIHIPTIQRRVSISGSVVRPSSYELLKNETFTDLLRYANGLTPKASSDILVNKTIPLQDRLSDDNAFTSVATNFGKIESIILNNSDSAIVLGIQKVDSEVKIFGQVKRPGNYPANNMSLKNILDIAGGFDDPTFRKTILEDITILRKDEDNFYSKEIVVPYNDADNVKLAVDDRIFVYKNINYGNVYTYSIGGQVNKPGMYPLNSTDLTIDQAIKLAGGLTELANPNNISLRKQYQESDSNGNTVTSNQIVNNATGEFKIGINSVINVLPYENTVSVEGNIYNPGLVAYYENKNFKEYIRLAGGFKDKTFKKKIYIKRANGSIEKPVGMFNYDKKQVFPGDTIVIPRKPDNLRNFDVTRFTADVLGMLTNLVAIAAILNNNSN
jgi:protein involved in polysaccharide export with SLBB domain